MLLGLANRHGLIAGAMGTGKTVTLQILAEGFSAAGVPVVMSDIKGDLSGIAKAGSPDHKLHQPFMDRCAKIGLVDFSYTDFPVTFWDLFGEQGHPVRTTVSEMALYFSRAFSNLPKRRKAFSTSPSAWPMKRACRCSI